MKLSFLTCLILLTLAARAQRSYEAYLEQAQQSIAEQDYTNGIKYVNKALEYKKDISSSHKIANLYLTRGLCKYHLEKYQEAEKDFDQAIQVSPEFLKAFDAKNMVYFATRQFDEVISNSEKALALSPNNTKFLQSSSAAFLQTFNYPKAIEIADSILGLKDDDLNALRVKSQALFAQKKYKETLELENHMLSLKPNDSHILLARGATYAKMGEYDKAEQDNELAFNTDSSLRFVVYNNRAFFINMSKKDYPGALALLEKCVSLNPNFAYAYSNISYCKLQLGDIPAALKNVQKSLHLDSHNAYAYKNYALIRLAERKNSEACKLLKTAEDEGYSKQYDDEVEQLLKTNCN